jgi:hypothetical protein
MHLRLGLPSGFFPSGFRTNTLYAFLFSPIRATCPAHLIIRITNLNSSWWIDTCQSCCVLSVDGTERLDYASVFSNEKGN